MTVCILGAGELGGAVAHALARGERVRRVLLIDEAGSIASGKALDIQQAVVLRNWLTEKIEQYQKVVGPLPQQESPPKTNGKGKAK